MSAAPNPPADDRPAPEAVDPLIEAAPALPGEAAPEPAGAPADAAVLRRFRRGRWTLMPSGD